MTYSTAALLTPSLMLIVATLGLVSSCSSADKGSPTLASTPDSFAPTFQETVFDPYASRNNGAWGGVYMRESELNNANNSIVDSGAIPAYADDPELVRWKQKFGDKNAFVATDSETLYHDSCAGCHMHKGEGAKGAGYYPPLANNSKMVSKYYILDILVNGFRGMPSFRDLLDDEQMAAVTQYVMNDLNDYKAQVSEADAASLRPDIPPQGEAVH